MPNYQQDPDRTRSVHRLFWSGFLPYCREPKVGFCISKSDNMIRLRGSAHDPRFLFAITNAKDQESGK